MGQFVGGGRSLKTGEDVLFLRSLLFVSVTLHLLDAHVFLLARRSTGSTGAPSSAVFKFCYE